MARRLNPKWIVDQKEKIQNMQFSMSEISTFEPVITSYNPAAQWLVAYLINSGFTPKVKQLGVGVKQISIVGRCCPTCGMEVK